MNPVAGDDVVAVAERLLQRRPGLVPVRVQRDEIGVEAIVRGRVDQHHGGGHERGAQRQTGGRRDRRRHGTPPSPATVVGAQRQREARDGRGTARERGEPGRSSQGRPERPGPHRRERDREHEDGRDDHHGADHGHGDVDRRIPDPDRGRAVDRWARAATRAPSWRARSRARARRPRPRSTSSTIRIWPRAMPRVRSRSLSVRHRSRVAHHDLPGGHRRGAEREHPDRDEHDDERPQRVADRRALLGPRRLELETEGADRRCEVAASVEAPCEVDVADCVDDEVTVRVVERTREHEDAEHHRLVGDDLRGKRADPDDRRRRPPSSRTTRGLNSRKCRR